jgi:hypothetical protein
LAPSIIGSLIKVLESARTLTPLESLGSPAAHPNPQACQLLSCQR